MSDSYGDGWNGNQIGVVDNHVYLCKFGSTFTSGYNAGPISCTVPRNKTLRVQPAVIGSWRSEIGFVVTNAQGSELVRRNSGS